MAETDIAKQEALSHAELRGWHTPAAVVDLLSDNWPIDLKRSEIGSRIQAGTIRCAAMRMVSQGAERQCVLIPVQLWKGWPFRAHDGSAEPFWKGATYETYVGSGRGYSKVLIQCFGIRMHPDGVAEMLAEVGVSTTSSSSHELQAANSREHLLMERSIPQPNTQDGTKSEKRPVSQSTLEAWWAMCLTTRDANKWRSEDMDTYFRQCFPDKSVTRERLRLLRGKQTPGPKSRAAE